MANILTTLIIKAITLKGKKDVKDLRKNCLRADKLQEELLLEIIKDNQNTEYGKKYNFSEIKTIEDYKKNVPLSSFDNYAGYTDRMVKNKEKNLITAYPVIQYAETSGSVGVPKKIPVSDRSMKIYTKYTISRVTALAEKYHREHSGRHLPIGRGFNQLEIVDRTLDDGTPLGNISGSAAKSYKMLFPYYLTSPIPVLYPKGYMNMMYLKSFYALSDKDMSFMFSVFMTNIVDMMVYIENNWQSLCDDIEKGTFPEEIKMDEDVKRELLKNTKPNPKRAAFLRKEFSRGFEVPVIPRIWPKMSFISTIGTGGFAAYTERMRKYSGAIPIDFSIYGASEGMMAACAEIEEPEFALLCDSCFFEFIPAEAPEGTTETLGINDLEVGKDYEIVITNLSGFYRYRIKDVVKVLGYEGQSPKITFMYRKSQLLDLAGDKITEAMMDETIKDMSHELNVIINDYVAYPDRSTSPAHYDIIIEADRPLDISKTEEYRDILEKHLGRINPVYKECIDTHEIDHAVLYLQQQQTHALWREVRMLKGASANQVKPVRAIDTPQKHKFFFGMRVKKRD